MLRQFWTNSQAVSCVLQKGGGLTVGAVHMAMPADIQTTGCALRCWGTFNSSPHFTCPCRASDKELIFPRMFALLSETGLGTGGIPPAIRSLFFPDVFFLLDLSHLEWILNLVLLVQCSTVVVI